MQSAPKKGGNVQDRPGLHYAPLEVSTQEQEKVKPLQLSDGNAQQYWRRWDLWRKILIWGLISIVAVSVGVVVASTLSAKVKGPDQTNGIDQHGLPSPSSSHPGSVSDPLAAAARLQKPGYHITPPGGWANDPNAMFQYKGLIHVFFQHNPMKPVWASPYWAHVVTKDLVHYMRLPEALVPDRPWDEDGVFSGSATLQGPSDGGTPIILYTGVSKFAMYGFYYQVQAIAVPSNLSDPYVIEWTKPADVNPLQMPLPVGGSFAQFRDPATAWRAPLDPRNGSTWLFTGGNSSAANASTSSPDMLWYTVVGAQVDCVGSATMYSSTDLRHWTPAGTLFSQLAYNYTAANACFHDESHAPPPGTKGFGGDCDQFGYCRMYECPEAFTVADGIVAFKYSDQLWGRQPFSADYYVLTTVDPTFNTTNSFDSGKNLLKPMQGAAYFPAQLLDYGTVYASKSFLLDDGRRIWLGWVYEDMVGCTESCAQGTPFSEAMGWQGMQTLPREVIYNPKTSRLQLRPIPELKKLRMQSLHHSSHALMADAPKGSDATEEEDSSRGGSEGSAYALWDMVPARKLKEGAPAPFPHPHEQRADYPYNLTAPLLDAKQLRRRMEVEVEFTLKIEPPPVPSSDDGEEEDVGPSEEELARSKRPWPRALPFEAGIMLITGEKEITRILLSGIAKLSDSGLVRANALAANASAAAGPSSPPFVYPPPTTADYTLRTLGISVDRTRSGGMTNTSISPGGPVDLPPEGLPLDHSLPLHLFIDHSVLEAFALGGSGRVTSHVYSLSTHLAWGVQLFVELPKGAGLGLVAAAEVFELDSCWVADVLK